jgi:hypothetical protein
MGKHESPSGNPRPKPLEPKPVPVQGGKHEGKDSDQGKSGKGK